MKLHKFMFAVMLSLGLLLAGGIFPEASAAEQMTASDACIEYIKELEGFSKYPYYDYSQYTVGYGTRCPADKYAEYKGSGITREAAEELLQQHITGIEEELNKRILQKYDITLAQNEFDALVSLSYNVGTGWVWGSQENCLKTVILSRAGESALVYAFSLYSNAGGKVSPGLVVRRLSEANLYIHGVYQKRVSTEYGYVLYDAGVGSVLYRVQGFVADAAAVPAADARCKAAAFLGWYTEQTGGSRVTELTGELSGKTLYAHWQSEKPVEETEERESVTVKVTGDVVNLRKGPGTNYQRIGQVYRDAVLTVSSVAEGTLLRWGETEKGWICLDYTDYQKVVIGSQETQPPKETAPQVPETAPETAPETVPETAPETVPETLPPVQNTEPVPPETKPEPPETEATMPLAESTGGQTPMYGTVKVSDGLRVRKGPGTRYALAGSLWNGNRVTVWETQTVSGVRWGRIDQGWVCMDYVVLDGDLPQEEDSSNTPEAEEQTVLKGTVKADLLRVRSGPGTEYSVLAFYGNQEEVEILDKVLNQGMYWGKTKLGWVSMDYIVLENMPE